MSGNEVADEADAVVVLRPRVRETLTPFLDLDDESEDSEGLYAEALDDGSFLVHTFQPFAAFEESESAGIEWLSQFGEALGDIHDDPRGVLVFPDTLEPGGRTYDAVVAEVEHDGIWIMGAESTLPYGLDASKLAEIGARLASGDLGGTAGGASSFELGQMLTGVQARILDALRSATEGMDGEGDESADGFDEEFEPEPSPEGDKPKK